MLFEDGRSSPENNLVSSDLDLIVTDNDNIAGYVPCLPQDMSYVKRSKKTKLHLLQIFFYKFKTELVYFCLAQCFSTYFVSRYWIVCV